MSEWRIFEGWSERELDQHLKRARRLSKNFSGNDDEFTAERGWKFHASEAIIAREEPGYPTVRGAFERGWRLLENYAFSDPRIVGAHYDATEPLLGRTMLLELKVLGLHYLAPVVVGAEHQSTTAEKSVRGFRYETLEGHPEAGSEWFLLTKNHRTGEVRFRVQAAWRKGDLPHLWLRVGFAVLAQRYQRAWHRLAHMRLRTMLDARDLVALPKRLLIEEPNIPIAPIQLAAERLPAETPITFENEGHLGNETSGESMKHPLVAAATTGAISGSRSMLGPAFAARILSRPKHLLDRENFARELLGSRPAQWLLPPLAAAEMAADKSSRIPARTEPLPLAGRLISGGLAGASLARPGQRALSTALGASGALATALTLSRLRRSAKRANLSNPVAGLIEDAVALGAGILLLRITRR